MKMKRIKCYAWTAIVLISVVIIAAETQAAMELAIAIKLSAFGMMVLAAYKLRKYRDIMDEDISWIESKIEVTDEDEED